MFGWSAGRRGAAPCDLQRHPDRLATRRLAHLARHVADDGDVGVRGVGVDARRVGDGIDVGARDVEGGAIAGQVLDRSRGAWMITSGRPGSSCLQLLVGAHERRRGDLELAAQRVRRLVGALPDTEAGMGLEVVDDVGHQLLGNRAGARRVARGVPEPHPAQQAGRRRTFEPRALLGDLRVEVGVRPGLDPGPDQPHARLGDLGEP